MNIASIVQNIWRGGAGLCCLLDPSYTRKKPNSSHIIPCKLSHHIPCTTGFHDKSEISKQKKKIPKSNRLCMDSECIDFYPFFKKKNERTPPPPCERKKNLPHHGDRIFEGKNYTQFFGGNRHELGKNGLRMHDLHPFFKNFLGETPPLLREDKKFPSLIWLFLYS